MPSHPDRVRTAPLPEGYQFGDAGHDWAAQRDDRIMKNNLAFYERSYERARLHIGETIPVRLPYHWNVIEGEHFASDAERHRVTEGFVVDRDCGDEG